MLLSLAAGSCSTMHQIGLWSPPAIESFHGISFGERMYDAQSRFPGGQAETSPSGAEIWALRETNDDGVHFNRILYEFGYRDGMQLVMASCEHQSLPALRQRLVGELGAPASSGGVKDDRARLTWTTAGDEVAILDERAGRLIIFGPEGSPLRPDAVAWAAGGLAEER